MPTTQEETSTFSARAIGSRTNDTPAAVDDISAEEDRLAHVMFSEGVLGRADTALQVKQDTGSNMNIKVGSGTAKNDYAIVEGDDPGQENYLVRHDVTTHTITVPASDPSNPRIDEVYLILLDQTYDATSKALPKLALRVGDPAGSPSAPGPDSAWKASLLLAEIDVGASVTAITDSDITDKRVTSALEFLGNKRISAAMAAADDTIIYAPNDGDVVIQESDGTVIATFDVSGTDLILGSGWTIDGVDPAAHASRHQPGGSDAIATAAPGTIEPDDAAAVGVATSLARSDHQHAIGAAAPISLDETLSSNSEGSSTSFARADHRHGVPGDFVNEFIRTASAESDANLSTSTAGWNTIETCLLNIPAHWAGYTVMVWAEYENPSDNAAATTHDRRIQYNGVTIYEPVQNLQTHTGANTDNNLVIAMSAHATGQTATGNVTVAVDVNVSSGTLLIDDVHVMAMAIRTS